MKMTLDVTPEEAVVLVRALTRMRLGTWRRDGEDWVWFDVTGVATRIGSEAVERWRSG